MNRARMEVGLVGRDGRTVIEHSYCEVPFKITRLHDRNEDMPHLILMHCTAGVFGGDELQCRIHVGRGARVRMTQQAATKVHASCGKMALVRNHITIENGAELHLTYDPVIPFADSRLQQATRIDVEEGAMLAYWESFMAGRVGHGEAWQFAELGVETQLFGAGQLKYLDRFRLRPSEISPASRWVCGEAPYVATGLYWGADAKEFAGHCHQAIAGAGVDLPAPGLAVVRVLAASGPELHRCQQLFEKQSQARVSILTEQGSPGH